MVVINEPNGDTAPTNAPTNPPESPLGRDALIGYLTILGIMLYPIGLYKLSIQLDRDYTHDTRTVWYAASLIPKTIVAGDGVVLLLLSLMISAAALTFAILVVLWRNRQVEYEVPVPQPPQDRVVRASGPPSRFVLNHRVLGRVLCVVILILSAVGVYVLGKELIDSWEDFWFYAGFVALSGSGGILGGFLIAEMPRAAISLSEVVPQQRLTDGQVDNVFESESERLFDLLNVRFVRDARRWLLIGFVIASLGALLGTASLARVMDLFLPYATLEKKNGEIEAVKYLGLSDKTWHGIACPDTLVSTPDSEITRVAVSAKLSDLTCLVETPTTSTIKIPELPG